MDIDATGDVTQAGNITGTVVTIDAAALAQSGDTNGTSVALNGTSLDQTGNIVSTGIVDIDATGDVTQAGNITGTVVTIDAAALAQSGDTNGTSVALNGASLDQTGNIVSTGPVVIAATGSITQSGDVSGTSVDIDADGFAHSGSIVSTGSVQITTVSTGASVVDGIQLADIQAEGQTVVISATGTATAAITDNNAGDRNILAADLAMTATAGVGAAVDALETEVGSLAVSGGTGGVAIDNTGNLNLQTVDAGTALSATGGAIALTTTGDLSISEAFVQGAGLEVSLTATGGSIVEISAGATADIVGDTINLAVTGVASTIGTGGETLELDGALLNASTQGGGIWLEDTADGISIGLLDAAGTSNGSSIDLLATGGSITESATVDTGADVIAQTVNLVVTGTTSTVGTGAERLELDAAVLNVTTAGGGIWLEDTAEGVAVGLLTTVGAVGSVLDLIATGGSITEDTPEGDADLVAETINLTVTEPTTRADSHIGANAEKIEIDAVTLNAATEGGSIWLEDIAGGVAVGLVTTTGTAGSVIDLLATGGPIAEAAVTDADADLIAEHIDLEVTGGGSTVGTAAEALELDAGLLDVLTAGGGIYLEDTAGGVAVGLVSTTGSSALELLVTDGSLTESISTDPEADVVASDVSLTVTGAASTIGTDTERMELNADTLDAQTAGGGIWLEDTAGGVALGNVTTTGAVGTVIDLLITDGAITEDGTDNDADVVAETVSIVTNGAADGVGTAAAVLEIDAMLLDVATAGGSIYVHDTAGGVTVGLLTTTGAGGSVIDLLATAGSITESTATDVEADIVADSITLEVTEGASTIGTDSERLELNANTLDATTAGGGIWLEDTAGGVALDLVTNGGAAGSVIDLLATDGSITDATGDAAADVIAETIALQATGPASSVGAAGRPLELDAVNLDILTGGGDIRVEDTAGGVTVGQLSTGGAAGSVLDLLATGGSIVSASANDDVAELLAETINLEVTGGASTIGTDGASMELDAAVLSALSAGGDIFLSDLAGGVAVDSVSTTAAANSVIKLHAVGGSITESGADLAADISTDTLHLTATGVGSTIGTAANALETEAAMLREVTTEGGSIYLNDLAGGVFVDLVSTGAAAGSTVELTVTDGSILESSDADADLIAETLLLTVTGAASTIGTAAQPLEIAGVNLSAFTSGGSIYLVDLDSGIIIDELTTLGVDGSTISLTALGGSILETEPGDPDVDIWTHMLGLTVTGANSVIGANMNPIEIRAAGLETTGGTRSSLGDPHEELRFVNPNPVPTDLMVVNGHVIGGGRIRAYSQALAVLRPYELIERLLAATSKLPIAGELILAPEDDVAK